MIQSYHLTYSLLIYVYIYFKEFIFSLVPCFLITSSPHHTNHSKVTCCNILWTTSSSGITSDTANSSKPPQSSSDITSGRSNYSKSPQILSSITSSTANSSKISQSASDITSGTANYHLKDVFNFEYTGFYFIIYSSVASETLSH